MLEKIVSAQMLEYMSLNDLHEPLQSAYKPGHSNETAILRMKNDIDHAIGNRKGVLLVLLDLSAAFDTVDHSILLRRMTTWACLTVSMSGSNRISADVPNMLW